MGETTIIETRDGALGRYAISHGKDGESELTYTLQGQVMVIGHTFTPPALRGHGIAARLVERAVEDARKRGWTINPVCPYVRIKMDRTPAMNDVRETGT